MNMKLPFLIFILCSLCINLSNTREITHEDIKDAMLSLVHMMRENTEKLERHDLRERLSGEQLKKTMTMLTKRVSAVDGLKAQLMKLESRITGIEQLISQSDERERIQMQKTTDTLEDLENRLEGWFTDLETKIAEVNNRPDTTPDDNIITDVLTKLNSTESLVKGQLPELQHVLKNEAMKLRDEAAAQTEKAKELFTEVRDLTNKIDHIKTSLDNIEEKSKQVLEKQQEPQLDVIPIMDKQERVLDRIHKMLEGTSDKIRDLPRVNEIQTFHNETQTLLQEAKHALKDIVTQKVDDIANKIMETKEETKDVVEALRMDLANNAERVNQELHDLNKGQSVMVSMADHVLDTKKRVEYGVHQILLEVGDLVKSQGININNTLNQRFDGISNDIMDNQNGALANLTIKMEHEMNQVWRQINVMYQQMMESAKALDKLHKQNEAYVNGTTSTMDGMESTVSEITKRMTEVDKNLNFLLGRLSLVTQEFNQIKTGLGAALDNIKASFKEVQEKANDLRHPGPHPVPENYQEINDSETKKPDGKPLPELEQKMINYIFNPPSN